MIQDIRLPFVHIQKRNSELHDKAIAVVVAILYKHGYRLINYDHIQLTVKKYPIPLTIGKRRFDVAFINHRGNRILIEL